MPTPDPDQEPHPLDAPAPLDLSRPLAPSRPAEPLDLDDIPPLERGEDLELSEPPQFSIKKLLIAVTVASVWLAAMQDRWLQGPCAILSLVAVCFFSGSMVRFVETRMKRFAAAGVWPLCSGLLAAGSGSVGSLFYGTLLAKSFSYSFELPGDYFAFMIGAFLTTLVLTTIAIVMLMLLTVITLIELFRRRGRDVPMLLGTHFADAALGALLFTVTLFAFQFFRPDQFHSLGVDWGTLIFGGYVGLIFGSAGVNAHFQMLDDARETAVRIDAQRRFKFSR